MHRPLTSLFHFRGNHVAGTTLKQQRQEQWTKLTDSPAHIIHKQNASLWEKSNKADNSRIITPNYSTYSKFILFRTYSVNYYYLLKP